MQIGDMVIFFLRSFRLSEIFKKKKKQFLEDGLWTVDFLILH